MSLKEAYEQNQEETVKSITNSILNREVKTKTILKDDFHAYLFNKVKNNFRYSGVNITSSQEDIIKDKIVSDWPKLKEKNAEWCDYYEDTHYNFLMNASKEDVFIFLDSLVIPKVLLLYVIGSIRRMQMHVLEYGFKNNYLKLDSMGFQTAIGRGNMEAIHYFLDNGFDVKADEKNHLKAAIINEDEEIQQFLIDNGCTTKNLPTVHEGDCSWVRSYENIKILQEKLSHTLEEKENSKQTKI